MTTNDKTPPLTAAGIVRDFMSRFSNNMSVMDYVSVSAHYRDLIDKLVVQQTAVLQQRVDELEDMCLKNLNGIRNIKRKLDDRITSNQLLTQDNYELKAERDALQAKLDAIDVREYSRLIGENERLKQELDDARIAELEAEIQELRKATEWQPIETAPKCGKYIRLWVGGEEAYGYYRNGCFYVHNNGDYTDGGCGQDYQCKVGDDRYTPPTHWLPLANPPQEI